MKTKVKTALLSVLGIWIVLMAAAACHREPGPSKRDAGSDVGPGPQLVGKRHSRLP